MNPAAQTPKQLGRAVLTVLAALWLSLSLTGCGGDSPSDDVDRDGGSNNNETHSDAGLDGSVDSAVSFQVTVLPARDAGMYLLATDDQRLVTFIPVTTGEAFCPDCLTIPPDLCPELCERHRLDFAVLDHQGEVIQDATPLITYFPEGFDHGIGVPERVANGDGTFQLLWLSCDNSTCGGAFSSQSCTGQLGTFDAQGFRFTQDQVLFERWWGRPQLVRNPNTGHLLVLHAPPDWGSVGAARVTVLDENGIALLPWTTVGSDFRLSQTAVAYEDGFVVVVSDRQPGGDASGPCETSCDCFSFVSSLPPETSLLAYPVSPSGVFPAETVASQSALNEPRLVKIGDGLMLLGLTGEAVTAHHRPQSSAQWEPLRSTDVPSTLWFAALAVDGSTAVWLGADLGDDLAQRLAAGVVDTASNGSRFYLEDMQPVHTFGPTQTSRRVSDSAVRFFVLRAGWPDEGSSEWKYWEILRVDIRAAY